uniref:Uncharacterized protein n=1 Tax=Heterorhabditis bacteriophora TaxID=37862 RepID=A0A1I7XG42_HETBA
MPPTNRHSSQENASKRLDALVWRKETILPIAFKMRSKSLTRLDEYASSDKQKELSTELKPSVEPLLPSCGRISIMDKSTFISDPRRQTSPLKSYHQSSRNISLIEDNILPHRPLSARQRTPITVEQAAQLDSLLPSRGVVKSMIRQIENPVRS